MKKTRLFVSTVIAMIFSAFIGINAFAAYGNDYRYWNQSQSSYWLVQRYGCWVVAQAKMLYEMGVDRSSTFNPDRYAEWEVNNGLLPNLTDNLLQVNGGMAPVYYASQKGKTIHYFGDDWDCTANQLWFNINAGYYTIVKVNGGNHYVFLDNKTSKATGTLYGEDSGGLDDKGNLWVFNDPQPLSRYGSWDAIYVYQSNVPTDTTPPAYSNFHVGEFWEGGFTVMSKVTDPSGIKSVRYAVWTENNGQDDIKWYDGYCTDNNDVYWSRLKFADHKNEKGKYTIHMYAYDNNDNLTNVGISYIFPDKGPTISNIKVSDHNYSGYTITCQVTHSAEISRVQFPTWTTANGQDDIAPNWDTNTKVRGQLKNGTATFRVNISEHGNETGIYRTHIYAYDIFGNKTSVAVPDVDFHKVLAELANAATQGADAISSAISFRVDMGSGNSGSTEPGQATQTGPSQTAPSTSSEPSQTASGNSSGSSSTSQGDASAVTTKPAVIPADETPETEVNEEEAPTVAEEEKAILSRKTDNDAEGSNYGLLQAKMKKVNKTSITLTWKAVKGATSYRVYGNKCGKKNKYKKLKTLKKTTFTQKKLKKGTYYKYIVIAIKDGKAIATSKTIHIATTGGKVGNPKSVKLKKKSYSVKVGKTIKIKANEVPASTKLKVKKHRAIAFESSNSNIATVSGKGVVKGVRKGICYIYTYAQNGVMGKVKVTVG